MSLDVSAIRGQFPLFTREPTLAYLDNAATTQKPRVVLDAIREFYETSNGSVHRAMHPLAERATEAYEHARETVRTFVNAAHADEILFTKNATEALNLVAHSWGKMHLHTGDTVLLSTLEHHSNIIPWLQLKEERGIAIEWIPLDDNGALDIAAAQRMLTAGNVKMMAITGLSNVTGECPPLKDLIALAHRNGAVVLIDAAQLVAHKAIDVTDLDCDFLAFSGHKVYGPDGIGVLYGKRAHLETMPPFLGGGSMVRTVTKDGFTPAEPPQTFEAGTPPVAQAVGLAAALTWLTQLPVTQREAHDARLMNLALEQLVSIDGLRIVGQAHIGNLSFAIDGVHAHDIAQFLGDRGICIRAGNHCAQILHDTLSLPSSARVSLALYNTDDDILRIAPALREALSILR